jgi:penicillin-binding protein 1B
MTKKKQSTKVRKRKAPAKRRTPTRGASGSGPGFFARAWRTTKRLTLVSLLAASAGGALVGFGLYRQALGQVQDVLAGDIWQPDGYVYSAPIELWPGLAITPEQLAGDLAAAGYARVEHSERPGDFQVRSDSVLVHRRAAEGPGWAMDEGEVLVTFRQGRVASVSPDDPAIFEPVELASIRGADDEQRRPRELQDFPEELRMAVLAMEDAHFFEHKGVSVLGITRALVMNALAGETVAGGSTLTQQVAKNLFLSQERTLSRKGHELLLAFALERELSKEDILALYLNEIYWGQAGGVSICGADEAARAFFGKPVDRLTLSESATLAGIISSPNRYSPLRHTERARERRDLALRRMVEEGFVEASAAEAAMAEEITVSSSVTGRRAPWVVDAAIDMTEGALGEGQVAESGLDIHTMINPALQRIAEEVVRLSAGKLDAAFPEAAGAQIALVAVRVEDGAIVAMVGGRDYGSSPYNRALKAERSPGSTIKPLTMLAAFEEDPSLSPASLFLDEPISRTSDGKTWTPTNYDGQYLGEVTLRSAIAQSRNVPAVLLAEKVGYADLQASLQALGLEGATRLPSAALGAFEATPVELAGAYTVFPGRGRVAEPRLVRAVTDPDGRWMINDEPIVTREASERAAYLATHVLQTVVSEGTGKRAALFGASGALGGKTGTTDDYRDAWFVGFTPELSVAVWVGFDQGRNLGLSGGKAAIPTWSRFVSASGTSGGSFVRPDSVVEAEACVGGFEALECLECVTELYSVGYEPSEGCTADLLSEVLDALPWRLGPETEEQVEGVRKRHAKRRRRLFGF